MREFQLKPGPNCKCPFRLGQRIFDSEVFLAGVVIEINYNQASSSYSCITDTGRFYWCNDFGTTCVQGYRDDWNFKVSGLSPGDIFTSLYETYERDLVEGALKEEQDIARAITEGASGGGSFHGMSDDEWHDYNGYGHS